MTFPGSARARGALAGALLAVLVTGCGTGSTEAEAAPTAPTSSSPAAPVAGATTAAPVRLLVPDIGVDTDLMELGLQTDGSLEVPPTGFPAGWFTGAPMPGAIGPAVMAGHVDWAGEPGVFYDLRELEPADLITVARADGSAVVFAVTSVEQFAKDDFPTDAVYGDLDHPGLRLITCGGSFDPAERSYSDNIVVFADLVPA
ncbi:Sortase family protein [Blastococcus fimeti]|nr:Sortase family protein [Blastococcus fimeti]